MRHQSKALVQGDDNRSLLTEPYAEALAEPSFIGVAEVGEAEFFVGALFRRRYRTPPPAFPLHYVCFFRDSAGGYHPIGYLHYTRFEGSYLAGGLVIDERAYRRIPRKEREVIRSSGGIAEILLSTTFGLLPEATSAIWAMVGDKQSEVVCRRVGFVRTEHPYIMVAWRGELSAPERESRLRQVIAYGPF